jgi:hypothetical protein
MSTAQGVNLRIKNVMRLQRTEQLCSVICVYEYGIPFA